MATKTEPVIRFRLLSVAVEEFAWVRTDGTAAELNDIDASFAFELSASDRRVGVAPRFTFRRRGEDVVILQPFLQFEIQAEDWPALVADTGAVTLPVELLQHLAVIAVGCGRGMLHEKVQRQPGYEQLMLPIIPVVNYVTESMVFQPAI